MYEVLKRKIKEYTRLEHLYLSFDTPNNDYLLERMSVLGADIVEITDILIERGEMVEI